ncbi:MAG TPA: NUDIX hydrolase [Longimicrobium sp.]|jgi:8-oxo-dGTP pyrophosphatase MutT (NUDIX family)
MGEPGGEQGGVEPWERVSTRHVAEYEMFKVREDRSRSPGDGKEQTFHVAESPGGVVVLAVAEDGRLVMVEQYRHGTRRITLELPSGVVDDGEEPSAAAARELREETGYEGEDAEIIGRIDLNPSWQRTLVPVALVRGARRSGEKDLDETEETRVRLVTPHELRRRIVAGEVETATTIAALAFWEWTRPGEAARD